MKIIVIGGKGTIGKKVSDHNPIPMNKVINGYVKRVEGKGSGEIIRLYDNC
jgi:hypothetical protein